MVIHADTTRAYNDTFQNYVVMRQRVCRLHHISRHQETSEAYNRQRDRTLVHTLTIHLLDGD